MPDNIYILFKHYLLLLHFAKSPIVVTFPRSLTIPLVFCLVSFLLGFLMVRDIVASKWMSRWHGWKRGITQERGVYIDYRLILLSVAQIAISSCSKHNTNTMPIIK